MSNDDGDYVERLRLFHEQLATATADLRDRPPVASETKEANKERAFAYQVAADELKASFPEIGP